KGPSEPIDAGSEFSVLVQIGWPAGTDPDRAIYRIRGGERVIREGAVPKPISGAGGIIEFHLTALDEAGEHHWQLVISAARDQEGELIEGSLPIVFVTVAHATSLAVWDIPSPVVRGERFEIKLGAKCSAACKF